MKENFLYIHFTAAGDTKLSMMPKVFLYKKLWFPGLLRHFDGNYLRFPQVPQMKQEVKN